MLAISAAGSTRGALRESGGRVAWCMDLPPPPNRREASRRPGVRCHSGQACRIFFFCRWRTWAWFSSCGGGRLAGVPPEIERAGLGGLRGVVPPRGGGGPFAANRMHPSVRGTRPLASAGDAPVCPENAAQSTEGSSFPTEGRALEAGGAGAQLRHGGASARGSRGHESAGDSLGDEPQPLRAGVQDSQGRVGVAMGRRACSVRDRDASRALGTWRVISTRYSPRPSSASFPDRRGRWR